MKKLLSSITLLSLGTLTMAGCSSDTSSTSRDDGVIKVVTTTDVYADIVKEVAGDNVEVTSLISSTSQDPHSYEATATDRLTVKDADLVLLNGGGYDQFLEDLAGSDNPQQQVIKAVDVSGLFNKDELKELTEGHHHDENEEHDHGSLNEHVWYSLEAMKKVSERLSEDLSEIDSEKSSTFKENAQKFAEKLDHLEESAEQIDGEGKHFITTEPVPNYLLQSMGMEDSTPTDLTSAVENESDIAPLTLQNVKENLTDGSVNFLGYNEQTASHQTDDILKEARDNNVPNASFTETLPEGKKYVDWMSENISNVEQSLAQ